jgi:hypothetical protein
LDRKEVIVGIGKSSKAKNVEENLTEPKTKAKTEPKTKTSFLTDMEKLE